MKTAVFSSPTQHTPTKPQKHAVLGRGRRHGIQTSTKNPSRCRPLPRSSTIDGSMTSSDVNGVSTSPPGHQDCVGVLLLNLGGPETLDDVQPFLYNLFADPDIIRLPPPAQFLQPAIAQLVSTLRAPKSREGYEAIGGGSPLRKITEEQARALEEALDRKGAPARTYVAMRYWKPFTGLFFCHPTWILSLISPPHEID